MLIGYAILVWIPAVLYSVCLWMLFSVFQDCILCANHVERDEEGKDVRHGRRPL